MMLEMTSAGAALPLVERLVAGEMGWILPRDFAAAVARGYLTPDPVLITATFVGYRAAGLGGAVNGCIRWPRIDL
jgi:chromate transporter